MVHMFFSAMIIVMSLNYGGRRLPTIKILLQSEITVGTYNRYYTYESHESENTLNKLLSISMVNHILYILSVVLFLPTQIQRISALAQ